MPRKSTKITTSDDVSDHALMTSRSQIFCIGRNGNLFAGLLDKEAYHTVIQIILCLFSCSLYLLSLYSQGGAVELFWEIIFEF